MISIIGGSVVHAEPIHNQEIVCLAQTMYFEAGNQSVTGKTGVGAVVMNRIKDGRFGSTPCKVIHQKNQFGWMSNAKQYNDIMPIAELVYNGRYKDPTPGALYFRSINLTHHPRSAIVIGKLLFYKV